MFDRYEIGRDRATTINFDVTERRAPTDESVRLLKEMERAAEAKVMEAVRCSDNTFDCTVHVQDDRLSDVRLFAVIFKLNGRKMRADYRTNSYANLEDVISGILTAVSAEIARNIAGAFAEMRGRESLFAPPHSRQTP